MRHPKPTTPVPSTPASSTSAPSAVCHPLHSNNTTNATSTPNSPAPSSRSSTAISAQHKTQGVLFGMLGVIIFAGSLPATRVAVMGFSPLFLTSIRATLAAVLAGGLLLLFRQQRPNRGDLTSLGIVALGVVVGFPLLTAFALQHISSAHSLVFIGLLPLCTAFFGVLRGGERPKPLFWLFACIGSACVAGYALSAQGQSSWMGNLLMLAAVATCGLGYAEGASLSRRLGGWQVISWALLLALPIMGTLAFITLPDSLAGIARSSWLGLGYVSVFSMLIGFIFWYRGLALGGIAAVSQLQLLQPFLGLAIAAVLLHEHVSIAMVAVSLATIVCVVFARRFAA